MVVDSVSCAAAWSSPARAAGLCAHTQSWKEPSRSGTSHPSSARWRGCPPVPRGRPDGCACRPMMPREVPPWAPPRTTGCGGRPCVVVASCPSPVEMPMPARAAAKASAPRRKTGCGGRGGLRGRSRVTSFEMMMTMPARAAMTPSPQRTTDDGWRGGEGHGPLPPSPAAGRTTGARAARRTTT